MPVPLRTRILQIVLTILFALSLWALYKAGYDRGYRDAVNHMRDARPRR